MFDKLKQLQELRKKALQLKEELSSESVFGKDKNGLIKITLDGNQEIKDVQIADSLLSADNKKKLETGLKEALSKAIKEAQMLMAKKMQSGDFKLPDM